MSLNPNDSNLKLLYGLDESGATAERSNAASANVTGDYALTPGNASGSEGLPVVTDGRGGKAVDTDISPGSPWTTTRRWLQSKVSDTIANHIANGALQDPGGWDTDGQGLTFGGRFKWPSLETGTGLGADIHYLFMLQPEGAELRSLGMALFPDSNTTPATGGTLRFYCGNYYDDIDTTWTTTGSPGSNYIDLTSSWYRWAIRLKYIIGSDDITAYVVVQEESSGEVYTFEYTGLSLTTLGFTAAQLARADHVWGIGCVYGATDRASHYGYQDECWYYNAPLSDDDINSIVVDGIDIPWNEQIYTVLDHDVRVSVANEAASTFPVPRQLPVGGLKPNHVVGVQGQRLRLFYEGFRAGRPWSLRRYDLLHDTIGRFNRGKRGNMRPFADFRSGLIRQPGRLPEGAIVAGYDMDLTDGKLRRRRGFRIRRAIDNGDNGVNSFYSWRSTSDELFWLHKVGDTLYYDTGGGATSLGSTGWDTTRHVVCADLDNRLVIIQPTKQVLWDGTTAVQTFGEAAPTGGSVAATTGSLTGTYVYGYTFYDPTTGDETEITIIGSVTLASEGAALSSLDTSPTESRFSQQRIYRSTAGGAAPNLFLIDTQNNASTYTDSAGVDGTEQVGVVTKADGSLVNYITAVPPATFEGCFVHQGRMFYWSGRSLYWSEPNEPMRWDPNGFITAAQPIIGCYSDDYRIVMFSRHHVEIVESDFERDDNGLYSVRQNVVSNRVGLTGPLAICERNDELWWLDRRGVYKMVGDKPIKQSEAIDNIFRYLNTGKSEAFSADYNHIRDQIWFGVAMGGNFQNDNTRVETIVVVFPGEPPRFNLYRTQLCHVTQFDDDLNGVRFGGMDHLGSFKEYESYEGEGQEGDETGTWEDAGTDDYGSSPAGISSISSNIVTVYGSPGWTTDEHRGKSVILRDRSTGLKYWYMIRNNGSGTLTLSDNPNSNLAAGDGWYIGGMFGDVEFAETDLDTPNDKILRDMQTEFDDLTVGRYV